MKMQASQPAETRPSQTTFKDLFSPLRPVGTETTASPPTGRGTASNAATPPPAQNTATSGPGSITTEDALSDLKHTEIPAFSASGTPGSPPLSGASVGPGGNLVSLGGMFEGKWAVEMMDAMLPAALVAALYATGVKLRKSELQLTQKEKDVIAPIMQKCLDSIMLNFDSPWSALAWTVGIIYGGKLVEKGAITWIDKKQEAKQAEALKDRTAESDPDPARHDPSNQSAHDLMNGNVVRPGQYPFTEDDVVKRMRAGKCSRDKAIKYLKKIHKVE